MGLNNFSPRMTIAVAYPSHLLRFGTFTIMNTRVACHQAYDRKRNVKNPVLYFSTIALHVTFKSCLPVTLQFYTLVIFRITFVFQYLMLKQNYSNDLIVDRIFLHFPVFSHYSHSQLRTEIIG